MLDIGKFTEIITGLKTATGLEVIEGGAGDAPALPYVFFMFLDLKADQGYQYIRKGTNLSYSATDILRFIAVGTTLQVADAVKKIREWFATQKVFNVRVKREGQVNYEQYGKIYESRSLLDVEVLYLEQMADNSGTIEAATVNDEVFSRS